MKDFEIQIVYDEEMKELSIRNANSGIYCYYDKIETAIDLAEALQDYAEEYELMKEED